ncbi:MAG: flagellar biosynthesis protein FlhB [Phycisphaerae bacterium]
MADDAGEKTEAPTPKRRQEAREKGQVAKSNDFSAALLLLGGMFGLRVFGPRLMSALLGAMRASLDLSDPAAAAHIDIVPLVCTTGMFVLSAAGPVMVLVLLISLAANLLQVGFLVTGHPLVPKLDKLNPINGFSRLFSARTFVQLVMNLLKLILVVAVATVAIRSRIDLVFLALAVEGWSQVILLSTVLYEVGLLLAGALLIVALIDFAWQKYKFERDLRMTKQEVKEELRRMDGDPILKQRRRKMQLAASIQRIKSAVPTADVVVTNPTELAIAIRYDTETMAAPKVVAKGADHLARKIREIAMEHGIPIIERKPLAQALYKMVEVGQEVPERFYKAIAEILAYVYKLSGRSVPGPAAAPAA